MQANYSDVLITALCSAGVLGPVVGWFMFSNNQRMDKLVEAVHSLVRITAIEVMSRPNIIQRAKDETADILKQMDKK